jgi:hypothetical protein
MIVVSYSQDLDVLIMSIVIERLMRLPMSWLGLVLMIMFDQLWDDHPPPPSLHDHNLEVPIEICVRPNDFYFI